jgi:hydrogenase maturation protease
MSSGTVLVIGYGNSLRRDDGAGLVLAQQLAARWRAVGLPVRALLVHQLVPELVCDMIAPDISVILFVDAEVRKSRTIELRRVKPLLGVNSGNHQMTPQALLAYFELYEAPLRPAWLLSAPVQDLEHGEGLSPAVAQLILSTVAHCMMIWRRIYSDSESTLNFETVAD